MTQVHVFRFHWTGWLGFSWQVVKGAKVMTRTGQEADTKSTFSIYFKGTINVSWQRFKQATETGLRSCPEELLVSQRESCICCCVLVVVFVIVLLHKLMMVEPYEHLRWLYVRYVVLPMERSSFYQDITEEEWRRACSLRVAVASVEEVGDKILEREQKRDKCTISMFAQFLDGRAPNYIPWKNIRHYGLESLPKQCPLRLKVFMQGVLLELDSTHFLIVTAIYWCDVLRLYRQTVT